LYAIHLQNQNTILALIAHKSEENLEESMYMSLFAVCVDILNSERTKKDKKDKKNKKAIKKVPPAQPASMAIPHYLLVSNHFLCKGLFKVMCLTW
jgi:hypothetical protein